MLIFGGIFMHASQIIVNDVTNAMSTRVSLLLRLDKASS